MHISQHLILHNILYGTIGFKFIELSFLMKTYRTISYEKDDISNKNFTLLEWIQFFELQCTIEYHFSLRKNSFDNSLSFEVPNPPPSQGKNIYLHVILALWQLLGVHDHKNTHHHKGPKVALWYPENRAPAAKNDNTFYELWSACNKEVSNSVMWIGGCGSYNHDSCLWMFFFFF